mgnify:CR=1 FL=1
MPWFFILGVFAGLMGAIFIHFFARVIEMRRWFASKATNVQSNACRQILAFCNQCVTSSNPFTLFSGPFRTCVLTFFPSLPVNFPTPSKSLAPTFMAWWLPCLLALSLFREMPSFYRYVAVHAKSTPKTLVLQFYFCSCQAFSLCKICLMSDHWMITTWMPTIGGWASYCCFTCSSLSYQEYFPAPPKIFFSTLSKLTRRYVLTNGLS